MLRALVNLKRGSGKLSRKRWRLNWTLQYEKALEGAQWAKSRVEGEVGEEVPDNLRKRPHRLGRRPACVGGHGPEELKPKRIFRNTLEVCT